MRHKILGIVMCMLLIVTVLPVTGTPNTQKTAPTALGRITIKIVAEVTDVHDADNLLGGKIQTGDTITGKYVYNSQAQDSDPTYPNIGYYQFSTRPYGVEINAGGFVFKTNPNDVNFQIWVSNDITYYGPKYDTYEIVSWKNSPLSNGVLVEIIIWQLSDSTASVVSSPDLPTTAPDLTLLHSQKGLVIQGEDPSDSDKTFQITADVTEATLQTTIDNHNAEHVRVTPLSTTRPYSTTIPIVQFWMKILERFPHTFPLLRYVLRI
jgi:hypothetical protein